MAGVLQLQDGASAAEWYSERCAHPEEKFHSALGTQLFASLVSLTPAILERLTRCLKNQDGRTRTERAHAANQSASSAGHHASNARVKIRRFDSLDRRRFSFARGNRAPALLKPESVFDQKRTLLQIPSSETCGLTL